MTWTWRKLPWLPAALAVGVLLASGSVSPAANSAATNAPNGVGARNSATSRPMQLVKSPVDSFKALLGMPAAEQQKLLAIRPPDIRKRLLEKINEYRSLTPEEREWRLQATEVRWYLVPLLSEAATNRAARLALIPQPTREQVEARLQYWTLLRPPLRQVLLTNQVPYIPDGGTINAPSSPAETLRRKMQDTVERLLELKQKEKEKALRTFSDVERQQMEKTIAAFQQLTPAQRGRCVGSFTRFATMTPENRQEFLKNAELWAQLSPTEREAWRELVRRAPIMPPPPPATSGE